MSFVLFWLWAPIVILCTWALGVVPFDIPFEKIPEPWLLLSVAWFFSLLWIFLVGSTLAKLGFIQDKGRPSLKEMAQVTLFASPAVVILILYIVFKIAFWVYLMYRVRKTLKRNSNA